MNRLSLIAAAIIGIGVLAPARPPLLDLLTPKCESTASMGGETR
jgi:hypothetical protein